MSGIVVLGAGGFLGHALSDHLVRKGAAPRLVARRPDIVRTRGADVRTADADDPSSLRPLLEPGAVVVNLVPPGGDARAAGLARACREAGVARLVHCSSAVVAGRAREGRVDEDTPCLPRTPYERAKLREECVLRDALAGRLELCIARPTAVFGPGGRNLETLVRALATGPEVVNRLRGALFGGRRMHLLSAANAAAALAFLARRPRGGDETYLVSEDDDPLNAYDSVARIIREALGRPAPESPALPPALLAAVLRLRGRSDVDPFRVYDSSRLLAAGFVRPTTLEPSLAAYARTLSTGAVR